MVVGRQENIAAAAYDLEVVIRSRSVADILDRD